MDTSFLNHLTHRAQVSVFLDLVEQTKFDLARRVYQNFDFTHEDLVLDLIEKTQFKLMNNSLGEKFKKDINQLTIDYTQGAILKLVEQNKPIHEFKYLFIQKENIHKMLDLTHIIPKEQHIDWFNMVLNKIKLDNYIEFTSKESLILQSLTSLTQENQVKVLSQSNAFEFIRLSKNYFKQLDDTPHYYSVYTGENYDYIDCQYAKLAIILNGLIHVEHPHFKEFLEAFSLNQTEKKELKEAVLLAYSVMNSSFEKTETFLQHFNFKLNDLINAQIDYDYQDEGEIDFEKIFNNLETFKIYTPLLQNGKKLTYFDERDFLFAVFEKMKEFFKLEETHEHFVEFLKFTPLFKSTMSNSDLLKTFFQTMSTEPTYGYDNYGIDENTFNAYLTSLEGEIIKMGLDSSEKSENNSHKKAKKIKI